MRDRSQITYQLAHISTAQVDLCRECADGPHHGCGALGPVQHGLHRGHCEGRRHGQRRDRHGVWVRRDSGAVVGVRCRTAHAGSRWLAEHVCDTYQCQGCGDAMHASVVRAKQEEQYP